MLPFAPPPKTLTRTAPFRSQARSLLNSQRATREEEAAAEQEASGASNASSPTTKLYTNGGTDEEAGLVGSASKLPKQQTLEAVAQQTVVRVKLTHSQCTLREHSMETCMGYLLDHLEEVVEDALKQGCEQWMSDDANAELFGSAGVVAVKFGVGVEGEHNARAVGALLLRSGAEPIVMRSVEKWPSSVECVFE